MLSCLVKINFRKFDEIYVDRWETPAIRYLFEYGILKNESRTKYPQYFTFADPPIHNQHNATREDYYKQQPKMNELIDYDLLIAPELDNYGEKDKWKLVNGCSYGVYIKN